MKNNRLFALCFRSVAFLLCLAGILDMLGVFSGTFSPVTLLYYTTESNILVMVVFGILLVRTALQIKRAGIHGRVSGLERLSAVTALAITVTMLIFWGLLAPVSNAGFLFSYMNLQVHTFTPLLMLADFFLFAEPGKLKLRDPWIFAALPIWYLIQSSVLGFSGLVNYGAGGFSAPSARFPYFFIDFDQLGARVFIYVAVITVFFIALAYLFLWIDRRRAARR